MNSQHLTLLTYTLFITLSLGIIAFVGQLLYQHGGTYIQSLLSPHTQAAIVLNKWMLTGYYLINLGLVGVYLPTWEPLYTPMQAAVSIISHLGTTLLVIGSLHYGNLIWLYRWGYRVLPFFKH